MAIGMTQKSHLILKIAVARLGEPAAENRQKFSSEMRKLHRYRLADLKARYRAEVSPETNTNATD